MEIVFAIWIALNIIMSFVITASNAFDELGLAWLNPLFIYKNIGVNWFGAVLLALVVNVIFVPYAILYWLYKLCTVGRSE